jgi:hypothetical protein
MTGGKVVSPTGGIYAGSNTAITLDNDSSIELTPTGSYDVTAVSGNYNNSITLKGHSSIIADGTLNTGNWTYAVSEGAYVVMSENSSIEASGRNVNVLGSCSHLIKDNASIHASATQQVYGAWLSYVSATIQDNADILIENSGSGTTTFLQSNSGTINITGGTIKVVNTGSGIANVIYGSTNASTVNFDGGTIEVTANSGSAFGYHRYDGYGSGAADVINFNGTNMTVTSASSSAIGASVDHGGGQINMTAGSITATSTSGTGYGIKSSCGGNITNGTIYGSTYGIYTSGSPNIGVKDNTLNNTTPKITGGQYGIYGGSINFYDGTVMGDTNAYQDGVIKAIPDGATIHTERAQKDGDPNDPAQYTGTESAWLIAAENYLEVDGIEFNSLTAAYEAVEDGGTIKVIADFSTNATPPESPSNKAITIDLNNHTLTYTQPLIINNDMTI